MLKTNTEYVLCSLSLVRKLHINPVEAINDFLINGIDNYSKTINAELSVVINAVIYDYYNNGLNSHLLARFDCLIKSKKFSPDSILRGFYSGKFDPEFERNELIDVCHNDIAFKDELLEFYNFQQASVRLKIPIDKEKISTDAVRVRQQIKMCENNFGPDATFMVAIKTLYAFKNSDKSKFEYQLLAAFLSIKSLEGKGKFCCTINKSIVMRMTGAKSLRALEEYLKHPAVKEVYDNYSKRYQFDKLTDNLLIMNFIRGKKGNRESGKSRLYISCQLTNNELTKIITEKNNNRLKRING